jgi:signal transduction histidine kinase
MLKMIKLHSKSLKLAAFYLAILMIISLFFSVNIYQLSTQAVERGLRGGRGPNYANLSNQARDYIEADRLAVLESTKSLVLQRLVLINLAILILGGLLSYYLANRTLEPIEKAQAVQSRFAADASHELRTPITALITENEVALADPNLDFKESKQLLESNIEELRKLFDLTERLMLFSGLENSENIKKEAINISDAIFLALNRAAPLAAAKNINIKHNISNNLKLLAYPGTVEELVFILLDNAVKYSPAKSTVSVNAKEVGDNIQIMVKDQGPGVAKKDIPYIFDRFY